MPFHRLSRPISDPLTYPLLSPLPPSLCLDLTALFHPFLLLHIYKTLPYLLPLIYPLNPFQPLFFNSRPQLIPQSFWTNLLLQRFHLKFHLFLPQLGRRLLLQFLQLLNRSLLHRSFHILSVTLFLLLSLPLQV